MHSYLNTAIAELGALFWRICSICVASVTGTCGGGTGSFTWQYVRMGAGAYIFCTSFFFVPHAHATSVQLSGGRDPRPDLEEVFVAQNITEIHKS